VSSRRPTPGLHPRELHEDVAQMEDLVRMGLCDTSVVEHDDPKLKLLLRDARIKPAVNEMELHPHFQQPNCSNLSWKTH